MTICFDIRALQIGHQNRGIGMFIKSLLEHLPADDNKYIFYAFDKNNPIADLNIRFSNNYSIVSTPTLQTAVNSPRDLTSFLKLTWHPFRALRRTKPDIFVQFDFHLGIPRWRRTKTVVMAYDLIPLIKKSEYMPGLRLAWHHTPGKRAKLRALARSVYYRLKYRLNYRIYKKADKLISISHATADSFSELLNIPAKKIQITHLAPVSYYDQTIELPDISLKKPYLFYIGGTDRRKRTEDIVYAFNIAKGRGADVALVLAGNEFSSVRKLPDIATRNAILGSPYQKDIHLVGFISDKEKMAYYHNAYALVFCSTYEGFGLPVIEAMSSSCPVISYNNSSIPEIAGNAALLVETGNYAEVARQIIKLADDDLRQQLIARGLNQAKQFSWDKHSAEFMKAITE